MNQLHYTTLVSENGQSVRLSTWVEDGQWWVRITINGVDRSYESLGPYVEAQV